MTGTFYLYTLQVCLNPVNVKTADPIWNNFCVGPHIHTFITGKVYGRAELKKKFENPRTHLLLFYNELAWEPSPPKVTKVTPVNYPIFSYLCKHNQLRISKPS